MIRYKTPEEIEILREGGKINDRILQEVAKKVKPGVKASELDSFAAQLIDEAGASAAFLGYAPDGVSYPYPASLCVSINEEVVHGIPTEEKVLKGGDIVTLDLGITFKGMITDHAITVPVGTVDPEAMKLIRATEESLRRGVEALKLGGHVGDFGAAAMRVAEKYGFALAEDLSGHGVGYKVHEEPFVPNAAEKGEGPELKEGLVIAVEPMLCEIDGEVKCLSDEYTYVTKDRGRAAHFEHTIVITKKGVEILTKM